jgi:hypothetical protein
LDQLLDQVLAEIRSTLFPRARYSNESTDFHYYLGIGTEKGFYQIQGSQRVVEIREPEIIVQFAQGHSVGGEVRGLTRHQEGKIILNRGYWCVGTLIHEALHSVSVFGRREDLRRNCEPFIEGMTELLTGMVLKANHPDSFLNCYNARQTACNYRNHFVSSIWCSLCHVVPLHELYPIYFWDSREDWERLFAEFTRRIKQLGYPRFRNVNVINSSLPLMSRLHQECWENFGQRYREAFESLTTRLDFSKIIL